ncbi:DNA-processing protein DprA [uncultured Mycobacterium sp.]|uniref:DNA-processing protein DprA n=1 Tax=uncultured Mycobacterium sp. TaxID=171292 RepID=UPI0035CA074F
MRARDQLTEWQRADFDLVTIVDQRYPLRLKRIQQCPPLLFVQGGLCADELGVSVVGSRRASVGGQRMAADIARGLVERGFSVVSGLAAGIDTAAHEATLAAGGRPIGVLGTGIHMVYPQENRALHDRVAAVGALVSQFLPDAPPDKHALRMRNATISGLATASVIVEAGEHSGSRILARRSVEHRRPLILTDVAASTRWGAALRGRRGVYVAHSAAAVLDIVDDVVGVGD